MFNQKFSEKNSNKFYFSLDGKEELSVSPGGMNKLTTWRPSSSSSSQSSGLGCSIRSKGKTLFEGSPSGSTDADSDAKETMGDGPFLFDVSSVPPAPSRLDFCFPILNHRLLSLLFPIKNNFNMEKYSRRGQTEVERLIYAYNLSGSQLEVDQEFIKRLVAFHKGFMVLPR